jgi:hypothetical protein
MNFNIRYDLTPIDLTKLALYDMYRSVKGVLKLLFIALLIALLIIFGKILPTPLILILIGGCLWFPIVDPLFLYLDAKKKIAHIPNHLELGFDEEGVSIILPTKSSFVPWHMIVDYRKNPLMVDIPTEKWHGYVIPNRMLKGQREEFIAFVEEQIQAHL